MFETRPGRWCKCCKIYECLNVNFPPADIRKTDMVTLEEQANYPDRAYLCGRCKNNLVGEILPTCTFHNLCQNHPMTIHKCKICLGRGLYTVFQEITESLNAETAYIELNKRVSQLPTERIMNNAFADSKFEYNSNGITVFRNPIGLVMQEP